MEFDIQYLLLLQELRNATGGIFDEFFNALSKFAVDVLPFLPFVIFWGVDKKWGYYSLTTHWLGELINGVIKLTVCAYRPWIRSDLIEPAGDSKTAATRLFFSQWSYKDSSTKLWQRSYLAERQKKVAFRYLHCSYSFNRLFTKFPWSTYTSGRNLRSD